MKPDEAAQEAGVASVESDTDYFGYCSEEIEGDEGCLSESLEHAVELEIDAMHPEWPDTVRVVAYRRDVITVDVRKWAAKHRPEWLEQKKLP